MENHLRIRGVRRPSARRHACLLSADRHGGDFISLSVYSGETGWNNIHKFWETPDGLDKTQENYQELMMSQSCLQVVFCCKDDLAAAEVESLRRYAKENGITFRGKNAYFCFRSAKPYHATWFLENETQADILETALHAALDIAAQLEQGKTKQELGLLPIPLSCPCMFPLRTAQSGRRWRFRKRQKSLWQSRTWTLPCSRNCAG